MRDKVKRFISILMTALMLVNLLPVGALADGITSIGYKPETVANYNGIVYVYVKVTGNTDGLVLNKDGWYTIGTVSIPYMPNPSNYDYSSYGEHVDYVWSTQWISRKIYASSVSGINHERNKTIPLEKVKWTGTVGDQSFGFIRVNSGATDYPNASKYTWHLDGYVNVEDVQAEYTVRYVDQDTGIVLQTAAIGKGKLGSTISHKAPETVAYNGKDYTRQGEPNQTFTLVSPENTFNIYYRRPYGYTVEYYYDGVKDDKKTETGSAWCKDVIEEYIDKTPDGYEHEKTENLPLTIQADESKNVIKVYYKKIGYTVTYAPGEYGTFKTQKHDAKHGDATPAFGGETTGKPGWKFDGWEPEVAKTVTGNATYTAKFVPKTAAVICTIDDTQKGYGTVSSSYQTILQATGKLDGGGSVSGSTATAYKGYKFVCWYKVTGEDTYEKVTDDPELTSELAESKLNRDEKTGLYQNTVFVAWFKLDETATVTYTAENGTVTHASDTILKVDASGLTGSTATANKGYKFVGWYKGDERITTDLTLTPEMAKDNLDKDENGLYVNTTFTAKCVPDENQHAAVIYAIFRGQSDYGFIAPSAQQIILQATGKQANGKPVSGSTATAKPGYKFVGWYKVTGWTTEWQTEWITNSPELTPELAEQNLIRNEQGLYQNTVFAAKFALDENDQAEVIYQVENGTILNTSGSTSISQFVQVVTGEVLTDVEATPNKGYKFVGWYKGDERITTDLTLTPEMAKDKLDKDENGLYVNTTFTAKCVPDEDQHATVIYTIDETQRGYGSVVPSIIEIILQATGKQANGNPISGSTATANKGYKFVGWYKVTGEETYEKVTNDPELTSELAESELNRDEKTGLYRNTVFEARFELDAGAKVPVTYEAENGTLEGTTSQEAHIVTGEGLTDVEATPNKGYKFDGWYNGDERITTDLILTPEMAKDKLDKDENGLYVNTTFTAKCVPDEDQHATVIYTIDETQRGYGSVVPSIIEIILQATGKQANGNPISGSTATANKGYKFVGWYKVTGEETYEKVTNDPELTSELAESELNRDEKTGLYRTTVFEARFELDDYAYTVEHYWIGDKDNPDAQPFHTDADESQTAPYGSTVKYEENGASWVIMTNPVYTFAKADPEKITISADASQNVLKLYYYKNVKLIANSETNPYNGKDQHVSGYTCAVAEMKDGRLEYVPWTGEKPLTFEGVSASGLGKDVNENGYPVTFNESPIGEHDGLYYVSESQTGTLTITPAPVTLQAPIASKTYDGTPLKAEDYGHSFVEGLDFADDFASISVEGSQTQAGSSVSQIKEVVPKKGKDLKNYKLTFLPGTLTITKRSVLLTSQSATKTYDGSALTRPAVTITGDGFVPGELAKVEATGSITNVGSTPNAIQYTTTGAFNPANYSIALSVGTLTVTAKPEPEPRRTFNLTVNYVYQNGKRAAASYNRGGLKNGETFDITSPVIAGYTASETVVSGTIDNRDIKVTVIYTADGVNLDDYGVPLGLGNITMNVGDCFE